jgi:hypothetical protein
MEQQSVEVWKNTAAGPRHFIKFDRLGHEISELVRGGQTFTITTFARQINQQRAASAELDLFRNGALVLVKAGEATEMDEIESSDSYTDNELMSLVHDIMAKNITVENAIRRIESTVTLGRLHEALVLEGVDQRISNVVSAKRKINEGGPSVRRATTVASGGDRMPKIENTDPEGESVASPGREIVPERVK